MKTMLKIMKCEARDVEKICKELARSSSSAGGIEVPFFFKLFKALIFFKYLPHKVSKTTLLSRHIFWRFHQKYYLLHTPSENFRRLYLKLQNIEFISERET